MNDIAPNVPNAPLPHYVVGFAFDTAKRVYLIRKNRPEWQRGKLNGPGGLVEDLDRERHRDWSSTGYTLPQIAMEREFKKETGLQINPPRWVHFHRERFQHCVVDFLTAGLMPGERPETKTDEHVVPVAWWHWDATQWEYAGAVYNLCYLVPMAYTHLYHHPANLPKPPLCSDVCPIS